MSRIRSRDTEPELLVRRLLHSAGLRYRLHRKDLPGTPDLTLKKWNAVIEVQGCFWHAHNCHLFQRPKDNSEFWSEKHVQNIARDKRNADGIAKLGMRRLIVWECALTGRTKLKADTLRDRIVSWLRSTKLTDEIAGQ